MLATRPASMMQNSVSADNVSSVRYNFVLSFYFLFFFSFLVWLVLLCSRTWYVGIAHALPLLIAVVLVFLCHSLTKQLASL